MKPKILYNYLTDDELLRISNKIKEAEKKTAGELAVSIREYKSFFELKKPLRQIAEKEYVRLGINKTKEGTGVLIFLFQVSNRRPENTIYCLRSRNSQNLYDIPYTHCEAATWFWQADRF